MTTATSTAMSPAARIDQTINAKVNAAIAEMNELIQDREDVIHGAWVGRVGQLHLLMVGPGGTGKSFLARTLAAHIADSVFFEAAFDETTDPSQVFGPPDIKAMVEEGKTRRKPEGMLPVATDAFLDEFFNANGPLLHSIMPALNERVFHNNGLPTAVPLRQALMGTNKLNSDADQAALWDRVHLRYVVGYVSRRAQQQAMVAQAIARMAVVGRGTTTSIATTRTTLTLAELDQAHAEALALDIEESTLELFFSLREQLGAQGIVISDRRMVEGMAAVLANAWVRNHATVRTTDLDILANMWWSLTDQLPVARATILGVTNPGEAAAMELLDQLDKIKAEIATSADVEPDKARRIGVACLKNLDKLIREVEGHRDSSIAAGLPTARLDDVADRAQAAKAAVGQDIFGIDPASLTRTR